MRLKDDEENAAAVALGLMKFLNVAVVVVAADERTNNLRMKTGVYQNKNETTSQIVVVFRCSNCCCFSYTTKIWHYSFHKRRLRLLLLLVVLLMWPNLYSSDLF